MKTCPCTDKKNIPMKRASTWMIRIVTITILSICGSMIINVSVLSTTIILIIMIVMIITIITIMGEFNGR